MTTPVLDAGRWRELRDRTPLRTQLVAAVLLLAAVAVVVTSVLAAVVLRDYLLDRVDAQLRQSARHVDVEPRRDFRPGPGPRGFRPPADYVARGYDDAGVLLWSTGVDAASGLPGPDLPTLDGDAVDDLDGQPVTVDATDGNGYFRNLALAPSGAGSVMVGRPREDLAATLNRQLKIDGTLVELGAPEKPLEVPFFPLAGGRRSLSGSMIGGIPETQDMLDFCAEHNVTPEIEVIEAAYVNEAYERVLASDVRYRFVIDTSTI